MCSRGCLPDRGRRRGVNEYPVPQFQHQKIPKLILMVASTAYMRLDKLFDGAPPEIAALQTSLAQKGIAQ
jgi:hypothetical protein